ncbi:MAG: hypothetical protein AAFX87_27620 [Bacteroidota bacterium]
MKTISTLVIIAIALASFTGIKTDKRKLSSFQYKGKTYHYAVQLPNDFDPKKTYPVLIGPSEVQGDDVQSFYWRDTKDTYGWILVDYQIYDAVNRTGEIKALMQHLKSQYNIENGKFHTVCFSANSAGIFNLVMAMPSYFSGITGMAGNPSTTDKEKLKKLKGVKVQFVVGDKDSYWMSAAKKRHAILKEIGVDSQIEIIPNGRHVLKELIGKGFLNRADRLR